MMRKRKANTMENGSNMQLHCPAWMNVYVCVCVGVPRQLCLVRQFSLDVCWVVVKVTSRVGYTGTIRKVYIARKRFERLIFVKLCKQT